MEKWELHKLPTRKEAVESVILVTRVPTDRWTLLNLYGLYIQEWEKRFEGELKTTVYGAKEIIHKLQKVVIDHGMAFAVGAVRTVFEMQWVTSAQASFLGNPANISKFIIPEMAKKKAKGEQAEWTAPREESSGTSLGSKQFFGKGE